MDPSFGLGQDVRIEGEDADSNDSQNSFRCFARPIRDHSIFTDPHRTARATPAIREIACKDADLLKIQNREEGLKIAASGS